MKRIVFMSFRWISKSVESSDEDIDKDDEVNLSQPSWTYSIDFTKSNSNDMPKNGVTSQKTTQAVNIKPVHTVIG